MRGFENKVMIEEHFSYVDGVMGQWVREWYATDLKIPNLWSFQLNRQPGGDGGDSDKINSADNVIIQKLEDEGIKEIAASGRLVSSSAVQIGERGQHLGFNEDRSRKSVDKMAGIDKNARVEIKHNKHMQSRGAIKASNNKETHQVFKKRRQLLDQGRWSKQTKRSQLTF